MTRTEMEIELLRMYIKKFSPGERELQFIILWNTTANTYCSLPGDWSRDKAKLLLENV